MSLTTIQLDAFLPMVMPYVGTCPQILAKRHIRQAAIEFCETTRLWREDITQDITASPFTIAVPDHASLHVIKAVHWEATKLDAKVYEDIVSQSNAGSPRHFTQKVSGTLIIDPHEDGEVVIDAVLKPRQGQSYGTFAGDSAMQDAYDRVPEFMHRDHAATIADGAIGNILLLPAQEFANPDLSMFFTGKFQKAIAELSASELRHQARPRLRTKTNWF